MWMLQCGQGPHCEENTMAKKLDASWVRLLLVYICWDTYKFGRITT
jgi:hypothetical protein